jgi:hypothetical protein
MLGGDSEESLTANVDPASQGNCENAAGGKCLNWKIFPSHTPLYPANTEYLSGHSAFITLVASVSIILKSYYQ